MIVKTVCMLVKIVCMLINNVSMIVCMLIKSVCKFCSIPLQTVNIFCMLIKMVCMLIKMVCMIHYIFLVSCQNSFQILRVHSLNKLYIKILTGVLGFLKNYFFSDMLNTNHKYNQIKITLTFCLLRSKI